MQSNLNKKNKIPNVAFNMIFVCVSVKSNGDILLTLTRLGRKDNYKMREFSGVVYTKV